LTVFVKTNPKDLNRHFHFPFSIFHYTLPNILMQD